MTQYPGKYWDYQARRELRAWWENEDTLDREEREQAEAEQNRYADRRLDDVLLQKQGG